MVEGVERLVFDNIFSIRPRRHHAIDGIDFHRRLVIAVRNNSIFGFCLVDANWLSSSLEQVYGRRATQLEGFGVHAAFELCQALPSSEFIQKNEQLQTIAG